MKKYRSITCILLLVVVLVGCGSNKDTASEDVSNAPKSNDSSDSTSMSMLVEGCGNKNGYYYVTDYKEDKNGDSYSNIKYIDYTTGQDIYVCNKPNCHHDDDSCTSYLSVDESSGFIGVDDENLYLITNPAISQFSIGDGQTVDESRPTAYRMDLDGSNKTKIYELPSSYSFSNGSRPIISNDKLYCVLQKVEQVVVDSSQSVIRDNDRSLTCIDLSSGKSDSLKKLTENEDMIGMYNNKIIFQDLKFEKELTNEEIADTEYYLAQFKLANYQLSTYDLSSNKTSKLASLSCSETRDMMIWKNRLYYVFNNTTIQYIDLDTNKSDILTKELDTNTYISRIFDGKLLCFGSDNKADLQPSSYFAVNGSTGQIDTIDLFETSTGNPIHVVGDTGNQFLVINGYKMDTTHEHADEDIIIGYTYALINKTDFFNGHGVYNNIKNKE